MSNSPQFIESRIVAIVKQLLEEVPHSPVLAILTKLNASGFGLQTYDLDFVLSRHPTLFRINYKGDWNLT